VVECRPKDTEALSSNSKQPKPPKLTYAFLRKGLLKCSTGRHSDGFVCQGSGHPMEGRGWGPLEVCELLSYLYHWEEPRLSHSLHGPPA
jgi:hypothetical protein